MCSEHEFRALAAEKQQQVEKVFLRVLEFSFSASNCAPALPSSIGGGVVESGAGGCGDGGGLMESTAKDREVEMEELRAAADEVRAPERRRGRDTDTNRRSNSYSYSDRETQTTDTNRRSNSYSYSDRETQTQTQIEGATATATAIELAIATAIETATATVGPRTPPLFPLLITPCLFLSLFLTFPYVSTFRFFFVSLPPSVFHSHSLPRPLFLFPAGVRLVSWRFQRSKAYLSYYLAPGLLLVNMREIVLSFSVLLSID